MDFRSELEDIVAAVPGCLLCSLIGFDGVTIASAEAAADAGASEINAHEAFLELLPSAHAWHRGGRVASGAEEMMLVSAQGTTIFRVLTDAYVLAASLTPEAMAGKARYLLRCSGDRMLPELV